LGDQKGIQAPKILIQLSPKLLFLGYATAWSNCRKAFQLSKKIYADFSNIWGCIFERLSILID